MRQSGYAILLLALSLILSAGSCPGPSFVYCVISGSAHLGACSDDKNRIPMEMEGWSCLSPSDQRRAISACRNYPVQGLNYCVIDSYTESLACADERILMWHEADNWACLSPRERQRMMEWCYGRN